MRGNLIRLFYFNRNIKISLTIVKMVKRNNCIDVGFIILFSSLTRTPKIINNNNI